MKTNRSRHIVLAAVLLLLNAKGMTAASGRINVSVAIGDQWKSDSDFERFYGKSIPGIMLEAAGKAKPWLTLGASAGYFSRSGKTSVFKEEIQFRQIPVLLFVRSSYGRRLRATAALTAGWLFFRERSYIGVVNGQPFGWGGEIGCEFDLNKFFFVAGALRFLQFQFRDPESLAVQQLGGSDLRLGIGINL